MYELIPITGLRTLRREVDDVWKGFFGGDWLSTKEEEKSFVPSVDFKETEGGYELIAEVPGLKPEEIEVTLTGDLLTIKGEKREEREKDEGEYHLVERRFGSFYRSFRLPEEVERGGLSAVRKDGVLTVTLPKAPKVVPTKVEVKEG
jgi:HSP20 family protein